MYNNMIHFVAKHQKGKGTKGKREKVGRFEKTQVGVSEKRKTQGLFIQQFDKRDREGLIIKCVY